MKFFALVLGLSFPFWLMGAAFDLQWMPGLSASALMVFCPMTAALILVYRENKAEGVTELLGRSLDFKRIKAKLWYVPILLLMPGINVVVYGLMRWMGTPLPAPQVSVLPALLMSLAFFVGARGEELGWSGYALDPMLFPIYGSHFDMRLGGLIMAFAAATVTVVWGPKTLARHESA